MIELIEYLDFFHPVGSDAPYSVKVHLAESGYGQLGDRRADPKSIAALLDSLSRVGSVMMFDGYPGTVIKIELNLKKKELILRAKLALDWPLDEIG